MAQQLSPTKANLLTVKKNLELAKTGYDLLDRKRNVLVREMMKLIDQASALQNEIGNTFSSAYQALQMANVTLGIRFALGSYSPIETGFEMTSRSVMGVDLPTTKLEAAAPKPFYGFYGTNMYLDAALVRFNDVKGLAAKLAGVENSVYRLAVAIKKTTRRANMLQNVLIPRYEDSVHFIGGVLEEHEREEFTRLKVIKRTKERKKAKK